MKEEKIMSEEEENLGYKDKNGVSVKAQENKKITMTSAIRTMI